MDGDLYIRAHADWEAQCLKIEPYEGFDLSGWRILSDQIVGARKIHYPGCSCCGQGISKGEAHRARRYVSTCGIATDRWCQECCIAMAMSPHDAGEYWTEQASLAQSNTLGETA